jgi:hypothetical protein
MEHTIRIETQTQGIFTRRIMADNYPDALEIGDRIADEIDGHTDRFRLMSPPDALTFDELISGEYGEWNYYERGQTWQILLRSGWFYTGKMGEEVGRRCLPESKLDPHTF